MPIRVLCKRPLVFVAMAFSIAAGAHAATTSYSTGFENPSFTTGPMNGQDGWSTNFVTAGGLIETTTVRIGSQAAQFQNTISQRDFNVPLAGQVLTCDVDLYHLSGSPALAILGDSGVFAAIEQTGSFFALNNNISTVTIPGAADGVWHHLRLELNFPTQTIRGFADGNLIGTLAILGTPTSTNLIRVGASDLSATDASFDNLSVAVPEPTSLGTLGLAAMSILRRRRWHRRNKVDEAIRDRVSFGSF